MLNFLSLSIRG